MAHDEVTEAPQAEITPADPPTSGKGKFGLKFGKKDKSANAHEHDVEKDGVGGDTPEPELQRKLKSRHLQMIAIGRPKSPPILQIQTGKLTWNRWYDWHRALHQQRNGHRPCRPGRSPDRLRLRRNHCLFGHDLAG